MELIQIFHDAGGLVFLVMVDKFSVYQIMLPVGDKGIS